MCAGIGWPRHWLRPSSSDRIGVTDTARTRAFTPLPITHRQFTRAVVVTNQKTRRQAATAASTEWMANRLLPWRWMFNWNLLNIRICKCTAPHATPLITILFSVCTESTLRYFRRQNRRVIAANYSSQMANFAPSVCIKYSASTVWEVARSGGAAARSSHIHTHTRRPCFAQCKHLPRPSNWALITLDGKTLVAIFFCNLLSRHIRPAQRFGVHFQRRISAIFAGCIR